ncbi:MAG: hypothetical protein ACRCYX_15005 [Dermatophilaceae bacterium]
MHLNVPLVLVGASGGLGTTSLALAVGRRLAATGPPAVVVDLDLDGGGLDVAAGVEHLPGRRWPAFAGSRGRVDADAVLRSLPADGGCHVLSAGGGAAQQVDDDAVRDVLASLRAGPARVVVDLSRGSRLLPEVAGSDARVVVVGGLRTRALADTGVLLDRLADDAALGPVPDPWLVTRGGRPGGDVLGDIAEHLGVIHVHHLGDDARVVRDAERGSWPGTGRDAVRRAADAVVEAYNARMTTS